MLNSPDNNIYFTISIFRNAWCCLALINDSFISLIVDSGGGGRGESITCTKAAVETKNIFKKL